MTTHSSILAWRISWTEEPGGLQSRELWKWTCLTDNIFILLPSHLRELLLRPQRMIRCIAQGSDHQESFPSTTAFRHPGCHHESTHLADSTVNQAPPLASGVAAGTGPGVTMVGDRV